ncbi:dimethylsulfonioproprionate lyase family protein [Mesobacterium sp. TK19101]|uniref:Dimethylsulfonioproprionate lyase family protein n=1 Tax=Mesobacterium hydrothermale TaxID=3111907 RepID=A0ABU6HJU8_9RHOB|nr:dimethylsulfonioproprionate lyase family protein [Mesobacterium sp. TK19101]MEC3862642.1 dimethylsulfonioproprionate lyase family protein [Mesobacterium sp. TK19101]
MTDADIAFARAYHAATLLIAANPQLMGFAGWPLAMPSPKPPRPIPAAALLRGWADGTTDVTLALRNSVQDLADYADWRQTYTEEEVGADFLNRYGWFELVGPEGHFRSDAVRAYIAWWGENLYYPWHLHEAEELYYILAGHALFEAEGQVSTVLRAGDIRIHASNQPHAMTTTDSPVLALVLWRGAGLQGAPRMGTT